MPRVGACRAWLTLCTVVLIDGGGDREREFLQDSKLDYLPDSTYHSVDDVLAHNRILLANFPSVVSLWRRFESTVEKDDIHVLKLTLPSSNRKAKLLLVCGEHAREFVPVESCFHLMHNLTAAASESKGKGSAAVSYARFVLEHAELYVIPMLNPDGRRRIERTKDWCWRAGGRGADVERNFDWEFDGPGSSANPKSEEYHGTKPFSENESQLIRTLASQVGLDGALILHSGSRQLFAPFADSKSKKTKRHYKFLKKDIELLQHINDACGGYFEGPNGETWAINDYTADGTMMDYLAGVHEVALPLSVELYGVLEDLPNCFVQFNPTGRHLQSVLNRVAPMYAAFFLYAIEYKVGATYRPPPPAPPQSLPRGMSSIGESDLGRSHTRVAASLSRLSGRLQKLLRRLSVLEART